MADFLCLDVGSTWTKAALVSSAGAVLGTAQHPTTPPEVLAGMDLVSREEFEAVKAMAAKAREEQEVLLRRIDLLESRLARLENPPSDTSPTIA